MALLERDAQTVPKPEELSQQGPQRWKFTRSDYHAMAGAGIFGGETHIELIEGEVYKRVSPIGAAHVYALNQLSTLLRSAFGPEDTVLAGAPIVVSDLSEPEPDIIAVSGAPQRYASQLPYAADVLLAVEVSDTTLRMDRTAKAELYAKSSIPEYWIVDLVNRQLIVHRDPKPDSGANAAVNTVAETDLIAPLARPDASITVADILPPPATEPQPDAGNEQA